MFDDITIIFGHLTNRQTWKKIQEARSPGNTEVHDLTFPQGPQGPEGNTECIFSLLIHIK